jgi:1,4-alpha-glucan branching enzyme
MRETKARGERESGSRFRAMLLALLLPALPALTGAGLQAGGNDNNVEWDGVFSDPGSRDPRSPGKNEPFTVELRVFLGDITAARVRTWDGAEAFHDMCWVRNEGAYDFWRGEVAGTGADFIYYRFEITDGSDTDYLNGLGMSGGEPAQGDFLVLTTPLAEHALGATAVPGGVVFRVWAPNAARATVVGDWNGWNLTRDPMTATRGIWEVMVAGARAGDEYKFVFTDGEGGDHWRTDPRSRRQVSSVGNSIVVDPGAYAWEDAGWVTPYFEEMIVYELHTGTFSGEDDGVEHYPGRYRDAADRHLAHLRELGVNVIELMPVGEFAGDRSWGYNPAFLFAPESAYGEPEDLKYLIDRCHQSGIAVILDVVFNHMGASDLSGNILEYDGEEIYFYPEGNGYRETPWGPRLDYGRVQVRDLIRDNVRYWLEEYHLDGFRLDGTDFIKVNAEGWQVLRDIAQTVDTVSRKAIVIAEQLPNDPAVTREIDEGGAGADYQWNDLFHDNLRRELVASRFGDPSMAAIADGLNHFALDRVVNYIESHDEVAQADPPGRVCVLADSSDPHSEYAYGKSKAAAALVLFSAGIPMLLQGQELLEERPFGDAGEHRVEWSYRERYGDFFLFMKDAIRLRRTLPALRSTAGQNVYHVNDGADVLAFHRFTGSGGDLVVVVGLNDDDFERYDLGFPHGGEWHEVLNGDAGAYGGRNRGNGGRITASGGPLHGFAHSAAVFVPRWSVLVFAREPAPPRPGEPGFVRGDCDGDGVLDIADPLRALWALFLDAGRGDCWAACDADADNAVSVTDALYTLSFVFRSGPPPAAPWPECGSNPGSVPCASPCGEE